MLDCFWGRIGGTGRAVGGKGGVDRMGVALGFRTKVGAELGGEGSVGPGPWGVGVLGCVGMKRGVGLFLG